MTSQSTEMVLDEKDIMSQLEEVEQQMRRMEIELQLKKNQLEIARTELDTTQIAKHNMQYELEYAQNVRKELEVRLEHANETIRTKEAKLVKMLESKDELDRKYLGKASENKVLKEELQKCKLEKGQQQRALEDLQSQSVCNEVMNDYLKRQINAINANAATLKEEKRSFEMEMRRISEKHEEIMAFKSELNKLEFYSGKLNDARKEKQEIEDKYIYYKTKYDVLKNILENSSTLKNEGKFFYDQWVQNIKMFKTQGALQQNIIRNLISSLKAQKTVNTELVTKISDLEERIQVLDVKK